MPRHHKLILTGPPTSGFLEARTTVVDEVNHTFTNMNIGTAEIGRVVVAFVFCNATSSEAGFQCTIDGVTATKITQRASATTHHGVFALQMNTGSTANLVVTTGGNTSTVGGAATYAVYGAASATPIAFANIGAGFSTLDITPPSAPAFVATGYLVVPNTTSISWSGGVTQDALNTADVFTWTLASGNYETSGTKTLNTGASSTTNSRFIAVAYDQP